MSSSKPQIVTSYRKELVPQQNDNSLAALTDEFQSTLTSFSVSAQSVLAAGDSRGNLFVGQRVNRVAEFQAIPIF